MQPTVLEKKKKKKHYKSNTKRKLLYILRSTYVNVIKFYLHFKQIANFVSFTSRKTYYSFLKNLTMMTEPSIRDNSITNITLPESKIVVLDQM